MLHFLRLVIETAMNKIISPHIETALNHLSTLVPSIIPLLTQVMR